jgi:hypothetical protein
MRRVLGWPGLIWLVALLGAQAVLPAAQVWHLESGPAAVRAGDHGAVPSHPPAPAQPHNESECAICHMIAAARQGFTPAPPVLVAVIYRSPEPAPELPAPWLPSPPLLRDGDPRGPPRA